MGCPHSPSGTVCDACSREQSVLEVTRPETLGTATPAVSAEELPEGTRVGRYIIQELIGRGGMGLVYTAHDPDLDRSVAIKLLRGGGSLSEDDSLGTARLLREAQAMAQLSHPNVLPVYDVGRFRDSVFMATERVKGQTLNLWLKAQPRSWREVREMFLQAGRGLQAAHAAGLVHRDFKPANVLVGDDGRVRVMDFGIARSQRSADPEHAIRQELARGPQPERASLDAPLTQAGAMLGTPGYMAPEQYAGLATSFATDQFAFCVSLYEGLYGRRPFAGDTLEELAESTCSGSVPAPPKGTAVPSWLHRVAERGLSLLPEKRYPDLASLLEALAADPQRRRRNLALGATVALSIAGSIAAVVSQVQQRRACQGAQALLQGAWDEEARAKGQRAFLATSKAYAEVAWEHAAAEMDAYALAWARARTDACEATVVRGEQTQAAMTARFRCLERNREELKALSALYAAADVGTVDRAYGAASRLPDIETCAHVKADAASADPALRQTAQQLESELALGRTAVSAGKFDSGREHLEKALRLARAPAFKVQLAETELALGTLERDSHRPTHALEPFQRAAQVAESAGADEVAAHALISLVSLVGWRLERPQEARGLALLAQGKLERTGGSPAVEAALAEAVGDTEWQAGNREASLNAYRSALARLGKAGEGRRVDVARVRASVGWLLMEMGQLEAALEETQTARQSMEAAVGADHPMLTSIWTTLGHLGVAMGDEAAGVHAFERALSLMQATSGSNSLGIARAALNLAAALASAGRAPEAAAQVIEAEKLLAQHPEAPPSHRWSALMTKSLVERKLGHLARAEELGGLALAASASNLGDNHPMVTQVALELGRTELALEKWAAAFGHLEQFLAKQKQLQVAVDAEQAMALAESGWALWGLGRRPEGLERLERGVSHLPRDGRDRRRAGTARWLWAQALAATDRARAVEVAQQALELLRPLPSEQTGKTIEAWLRQNAARHPTP